MGNKLPGFTTQIAPKFRDAGASQAAFPRWSDGNDELGELPYRGFNT